MIFLLLKSFISNFQIYPVSDLGEEEIEEYQLLSGFTPSQIHKYRNRLSKYVANANYIAKDEFMKIPSVVNCPLLDRLVAIFGFDEDKTTITFLEYLQALYQFNGDTVDKEQKVHLLFRLHDYDGDGRLSKFDLVRFLEAVIEYKSESIDLEFVAESILQEFDSSLSIDFDQFSKVMGASQDFHTRLILPL